MKQKLDIRLIAVGVIVHLIIFYSIFDVYFKSPLVNGMDPVQSFSSSQSPAKRLVLFVADGLRADSFFNSIKQNEEMYLSKQRTLKNTVYAISHTQVPPESRPGHVAMISGFFEDISAIATGWKENPVDFDSVFIRSRYTWSWGSPDILNMFSRSSKNVFPRTYDAAIEDFAAKDASALDSWVLHHVKVTEYFNYFFKMFD